MALSDTRSMDVPWRGGSASGILFSVAPFLATTTMDVPSRGASADWVQTPASASLPPGMNMSAEMQAFESLMASY